MSQTKSLERMLADLMAEEASGGVPDQLIDQIHSATSRIRPLPRWLAVLREPPMHARARVAVGMPTRQLALIGALLLLAAAATIAAAAALLLTPQPIADEWSGFRGDATRGGVAVTGPIGNPSIRWQFRAKGAIASDVAVAADLVLAPSDDGILHALDLTAGTERWSYPAAAPMRGPFVAEGRVYVADGDVIVHALSLADGKVVWSAAERLALPSDLAVIGGRLYVGTQDGMVLALSTADGSVAWRTPLGKAAIHTPAISGNAVAISTDARELAVLDPTTGTTRWRVPAGSASVGTPVISGTTVYLGGTDAIDGQLAAYDLATGAERWQIEQNIYSPSLSGVFGYTGSAVGRVTAIDLASGAEKWVAQFTGTVRAPAIAGNIVYLGLEREHRVVALDGATGGELWSTTVDGSVDCCIAAARGMVFVGTSTGTVVAIGGDGASLTATAPPSVAASPSASTAPSLSAPSIAPTESLLPARLLWTATSGESFNPWGLAQAPDGRLWASIARENRFDIFSADGTFLESWGTGGTANRQFNLRRGNGDEYGMLAFASDGSFYVLDVGNRRVQAFDSRRKFLRAWGSFGNEKGYFNDPVSIAVDADGNVNVLDDIRQVVEVYTPAGKVVRTVSAFPEQVQPNEGANQVQIGPNGHFYVSVAFPNLVAELDRDGTLVRTYGDGTKGFSFTDQPNRVAFDGAGRMYVAQSPLRSGPGVVIFAPDGTYLGGFGAIGTGESELKFPWGLIVTNDGIYVADAMAPAALGLRKFAPVDFP